MPLIHVTKSNSAKKITRGETRWVSGQSALSTSTSNKTKRQNRKPLKHQKIILEMFKTVVRKLNPPKRGTVYTAKFIVTGLASNRAQPRDPYTPRPALKTDLQKHASCETIEHPHLRHISCSTYLAIITPLRPYKNVWRSAIPSKAHQSLWSPHSVCSSTLVGEGLRSTESENLHLHY